MNTTTAPRSHRRFFASIAAALLAVCMLAVPIFAAAAISISQTPLFLTNAVEPNIMLALDDSGSMDAEVQFQTNDGALWWNSDNSPPSFLNSTSAVTFNFNSSGDASGDWYKYFYLFPDGHQSNSVDTSIDVNGLPHAHFAVPPIPAFAFARSPDYNKAYFNPSVTYSPWISTSQYTFSNSPPTAARVDPVTSYTTWNTVDLTREIASDAGAAYEFEVLPGMTVPTGTVYESGNTWVTAASDNTVSSQHAVPIAYYPATFWLSQGSALPSDYSSFLTGATFDSTSPNTNVTVTNNCSDSTTINGVDFTRYRIAPACFSDSAQYTAAMQNFANWFTYYRKRSLAVRGSVGRAFSTVNYARVGEFTINHRPSSASDLTMWNLSSTQNLYGLLNQVYPQSPGGGTPNKDAVNTMGQLYESTQDTAGGTTPPIQYSCQRNFGMLFTDGYSDASGPTAEADANMGHPFSDDVSNTIADIASQYYNTNLRPNLSGGPVLTPSGCNVTNPDPRLDCNTFPHMQTFAVTLPKQGLIYGVNQSATTDPYTYNGGLGPDWDSLATALTQNRNPAAIDDLWHMTLNTRGEFLNADTPAKVAGSLKQALNTIATENSSAATIATNSTQLTNSTRFYEAEFASADWHGDVVAFKLNAAGQTTSEVWDAATQLTGSSGRHIFTFNDALNSGQGGGANFSTTSISANEITALTPSSPLSTNDTWENRLAWLSGNRSMEGAPYRTRNSATVMGDVVNSDPLFVGNQDFGYAGLANVPGDASYASYVQAKQTTVLNGGGLLMVGANDGMLHAFDASTGQELFAYVPEAVYPNLDLLADPTYSHHYYVDGSPATGDAFVNGAWHTFVVETLGAGGRGVFALDVTNPLQNPGTTPSASTLVKWEFSTSAMGNIGDPLTISGAAVNFNDLGYTLPRADIALVNCSTCTDAVNGEVWAAIVPNGYGSTSGTAALFILDLNTGQVIREINTDDTGTSQNNGLSGAVPVDVDGNRTADYVYAGDLQGNLWKFDLTNTDPSQWHVSLGSTSSPAPMFKATDASGTPQPITSRPAIGTDSNGGLLIYFGTGSYFQTGDNNLSGTPQTQTFYAVRDPYAVSAASTGNQKTLSRSDLLQQSFIASTTVGGNEVRVSTNNTMDYTKYDGWYIDLTGLGPGERVVSSPTLDNGRIIFNTLIPSSSACTYGGNSYLVELDANSGGRLDYTPLDLNGDKIFDQQDYATVTDPTTNKTITVPVSAVHWGIGIVKNQAIVGKGSAQYKLAAGTGSTAIKVLFENSGPSAGRLSWRQLR